MDTVTWPCEVLILEGIRDGVRVSAKDGYSDGVYEYYRTDSGMWKSVMPEMGRHITDGATLEDAIKNTYAPSMANRIRHAVKEHGDEFRDIFCRACEKAGFYNVHGVWTDSIEIGDLSDLL